MVDIEDAIRETKDFIEGREIGRKEERAACAALAVAEADRLKNLQGFDSLPSMTARDIAATILNRGARG